jgi:cell division protease FtsH
VSLAPPEGSYPSAADGFGLGAGKPYSESTAEAIDAEVRRLLEEAAAEAGRLLTLRRSELDALATALLAQETLDEPAIRRATGLLARPRVELVPLTTAAFTAR